MSQINLNLNVLLRQKKDVERELFERASPGGAGSPGGATEARQLREKLAVLEGGIAQKTAEIAQAPR